MKTETFRLLPSNLISLNLNPGGGQPKLKLVCEPVDKESETANIKLKHPRHCDRFRAHDTLRHLLHR